MEDKANLHPGTPTLTVAEVGELFGLKPYTLHKWRKSGNGPLMIREKREIVNFLGKPQTLLVWVCPIDELRAWMKEHRPAQVVALDKLLSERAEG